eukprot:CAMPEP_0170617380 /NCGR_PEP_ID=MMETSP0224-20130122/26389_1 /TAXON_ID=285029 /ORGANISM="Togula jolla, Strain CCCM 725" /LENGTH=73 /DNA_ID=CAMNT_0010943273 /DNA_START=406 /DNA_END=628 /DNA_ORIENTATION=+
MEAMSRVRGSRGLSSSSGACLRAAGHGADRGSLRWLWSCDRLRLKRRGKDAGLLELKGDMPRTTTSSSSTSDL